MSNSHKQNKDDQRHIDLSRMGLPVDKEPVFLREGACDGDIAELEVLIESKVEPALVRRLRVIRSLMIGRSWKWILARHRITREELISWTQAWNTAGYSGIDVPRGKGPQFPPLRQSFREHGSDIFLGDDRPRVVPRFDTPADRAARKELRHTLDASIANLNRKLGGKPCRR